MIKVIYHALWIFQVNFRKKIIFFVEKSCFLRFFHFLSRKISVSVQTGLYFLLPQIWEQSSSQVELDCFRVLLFITKEWFWKKQSFFEKQLDIFEKGDILLLSLSRSVAQPGIRALGSGPRGRKFESCHSDHFFLNSFISISYSDFSCSFSALKWTTNWTTTKENVFHGSRNPESRQA